jgi:hypothetical protein
MKTKYDPDNVFHHNQNIRPRSERTAAASRPAALVPGSPWQNCPTG